MTGTDWDWQETEILIYLNAGSNTFRLTSIADGPNLDKIDVIPID